MVVRESRPHLLDIVRSKAHFRRGSFSIGGINPTSIANLGDVLPEHFDLMSYGEPCAGGALPENVEEARNFVVYQIGRR